MIVPSDNIVFTLQGLHPLIRPRQYGKLISGGQLCKAK